MYTLTLFHVEANTQYILQADSAQVINVVADTMTAGAPFIQLGNNLIPKGVYENCVFTLTGPTK